MIDFLLGVPGKLKAISDYLTGTLYPYITSRTANLDAAVTSRAAASTALTNATWTDTRAGKLDTVILSSVIQSIQTGYKDAAYPPTGSGEDIKYVDTAISSVVPAKCIILIDGVRGHSTGTQGQALRILSNTARLTSATNLRVSFQGTISDQEAVASTENISFRWTVVEFK